MSDKLTPEFSEYLDDLVSETVVAITSLAKERDALRERLDGLHDILIGIMDLSRLGNGDSPEANAVRDRTDKSFRGISAGDKRLVENISEWYLILERANKDLRGQVVMLREACKKSRYILVREIEMDRIMRSLPNSMTEEAFMAVEAALAATEPKGSGS